MVKPLSIALYAELCMAANAAPQSPGIQCQACNANMIAIDPCRHSPCILMLLSLTREKSAVLSQWPAPL